MSVLYLYEGFRATFIFQNLSPLLKDVTLRLINPNSAKDLPKNISTNLPVLALNEMQISGFKQIVHFLFPQQKLDQLILLDSVLSLLNSLYDSICQVVCKQNSILISDQSIADSSLKTEKIIAHISSLFSQSPVFLQNIIISTLSVIGSLGVTVNQSFAEAQFVPPDNLIDEALRYSVSILKIPERYEMSPPASKKVYFTTPIYYVNGKPHIGHIFTTTLVETLSNWYKLRGFDTLYSSGVDEHGLKVETTARSKGFTPQDWCDKTTEEFRVAFNNFGLKPDLFMRTTFEEHATATHFLWKTLFEKGYIYLGTYQGWYSKTEEAFIAENQVEERIVDGVGKHFNTEDNSELFWQSEQNYMFKLSVMQQPILDWLARNPTCITPKCYYNQIVQMVKAGLTDISVSRQKVKWGIPVPGDPNQTIYVWFDALTSYLTGAKWGEGGVGFWPCDLHTIGKDIVKFHAIFWPGFLLAAGIEPYKRLLVHGWWTKNDVKMSKTLGNTLDPETLSNFWGIEALKYFLLREATLVSDSDYSDEAMLHRYNNDLADVLGNLVMRVISKSILPDLIVPTPGQFNEADQSLIEKLSFLPNAIDHFIGFGMTRAALTSIWDSLRDLNKYLTENKPWALKKTDVERFSTVIYILLEALRLVSICLKSFLKITATKILTALGVADLTDPQLIFKFGSLPPGTQLSPIEVLFEKKVLEFN